MNIHDQPPEGYSGKIGPSYMLQLHELKEDGFVLCKTTKPHNQKEKRAHVKFKDLNEAKKWLANFVGDSPVGSQLMGKLLRAFPDD